MAEAERVAHPERWAVLDHRGIPIPEVTSYLRHLHSIERSPNTVKGYASDLALFFTWAHEEEQNWAGVDNEALGRFIHWLRTPREELVRPSNPAGQRSKKTANRAMSALAGFAFHLYDTTSDEVYAHLLKTARTHKSKYTEEPHTTVVIGPRLGIDEAAPETLTLDEIQAICDACRNLRDRFLFSLLRETGMRIGQALLLRHEDIRVPKSTIWVQRHENDSTEREELLRNKSVNFAEVPVPPWLIRLYAAYMNAEYGLLDSDFVFVNLWSGRIGAPMTYSSVNDLVKRLRKRTGIHGWSAHTFRHSYVTRLLDAGVSPKVVAYLVTHASVLTTLNIYGHTQVETVRKQLIESGVWSDAG